MDFGTGKGVNLFYISNRFPNFKFTGIDINNNNNLIEDSETFFINNKIKNCSLEYGDVYNLNCEKYKNVLMG